MSRECRVHPEIPSPYCPECDQIFEEADIQNEKNLLRVIMKGNNMTIWEKIERSSLAFLFGGFICSIVSLFWLILILDLGYKGSDVVRFKYAGNDAHPVVLVLNNKEYLLIKRDHR
jgi:hypothetical protein